MVINPLTLALSLRERAADAAAAAGEGTYSRSTKGVVARITKTLVFLSTYEKWPKILSL